LSRRARLAGLCLLLGVAFAIAFPGAGERGVTSEEVQPYLERYPFVVDHLEGHVAPVPPYEEGAPPRPRWVSTSQWPVVAYDGESRLWPLFIRGHQTAIGAYWGLAFGPLLGGGVAGMQRANVLFSLSLVGLTYLFAARVLGLRKKEEEPFALLPPALVAGSFGLLFFGRTGYAFELSSRVFMLAALVLAAKRAPLTYFRGALIGFVASIAVLCRATIAVTLAPALLLLVLRESGSRKWLRRATPFVVMALVPVLFVAFVSFTLPFHQGTAPLAGFPLGQLPSRLLDVPGHLLVQVAWLGDASSILRPLRSGAGLVFPMAIGLTLGLPVVAAAFVRLARGRALLAERMLLASLAGNVLGGALLYGDPMQFQLAMALEPIVALALTEQVLSLGTARRRSVVVAVAMAARMQSVVLGLWLDRHGVNPMFSGLVQQAATAKLEALGTNGHDVLTTTYNHVGVVEAWTRGAIRPVHGFPSLRVGGPPGGPSLAVRMRALLEAYHPRYVMLTDGKNLYEGPATDNDAIALSLREGLAALGGRIGAEWAFPTEAGAKGWRIVEVIYAGSKEP